jgi:hypothetical protein
MAARRTETTPDASTGTIITKEYGGGATAVGRAAAPRNQYAGGSHPDKADDPHRHQGLSGCSDTAAFDHEIAAPNLPRGLHSPGATRSILVSARGIGPRGRQGRPRGANSASPVPRVAPLTAYPSTWPPFVVVGRWGWTVLVRHALQTRRSRHSPREQNGTCKTFLGTCKTAPYTFNCSGGRLTLLTGATKVGLARKDCSWLLGAILAGGRRRAGSADPGLLRTHADERGSPWKWARRAIRRGARREHTTFHRYFRKFPTVD